MILGITKKLLEPWIQEGSLAFLEELHKEISEKHILFGEQLVVVARRIDQDDILLQFADNPNQYAQVHLTWCGDTEPDPKWPKTRIFESFERWSEEVMKTDNMMYEE